MVQLEKCFYFIHLGSKAENLHIHHCANSCNKTHRCGFSLEDWKCCPLEAGSNNVIKVENIESPCVHKSKRAVRCDGSVNLVTTASGLMFQCQCWEVFTLTASVEGDVVK